jgi:hypothetical protein
MTKIVCFSILKQPPILFIVKLYTSGLCRCNRRCFYYCPSNDTYCNIEWHRSAFAFRNIISSGPVRRGLFNWCVYTSMLAAFPMVSVSKLKFIYWNLLLAPSNVINSLYHFHITHRRTTAFQWFCVNINKDSSVALVRSPRRYLKACEFDLK